MKWYWETLRASEAIFCWFWKLKRCSMTELEKAISNDLSVKVERSVASPVMLTTLGKSVSTITRFRRVISTSVVLSPALFQNSGVPPMSRILTGFGRPSTKLLKRFNLLDLNEDASELGFLLSAMEEKSMQLGYLNAI